MAGPNRSLGRKGHEVAVPTGPADQGVGLPVHPSNWTLIRWHLAREQDQSGQGSETYTRAKSAETLIDRQLTRNLRGVHFEPQAMDVAYRWRIETTVILKENGYTFFD